MMNQILVTAGVIHEANRILVARRRLDDREGGKWEFPGGKVEPGEDPRQAIRRELREELGIEAEAGRILDVVSVADGAQHLILLYFTCRIVSGVPSALQCQEVRFLEPEQIDRLEKPAADACFWRNYRTAPGLDVL